MKKQVAFLCILFLWGGNAEISANNPPLSAPDVSSLLLVDHLVHNISVYHLPALREESGVILSTAYLWIGIPDTNGSSVLAKLVAGTKVKVLDLDKGYYKVIYRNLVGYVEQALVGLVEREDGRPITDFKEEAPSPSLTRQPAIQPSSSFTVLALANLKQQPFDKASTLKKVAAGQKVRFINSYSADWWEVDYKGVRGFVQSNDLMSTRTVNSSAQPTVKPEAINVDPGELNFYYVNQATSLRHGPTSKTGVILRLPVDGQVNVLDSSGKYWWKVVYKGKTGYAKSALLRDTF